MDTRIAYVIMTTLLLSLCMLLCSSCSSMGLYLLEAEHIIDDLEKMNEDVKTTRLKHGQKNQIDSKRY